MKLVCLKKDTDEGMFRIIEINIRKEEKEGKYRKNKIKVKQKQQL